MSRFQLTATFLTVGIATVFAQSTQSPLPSEKPATFDGKMNPPPVGKPDKNHIRDLSGVVRDGAGDPIPGAVVQLKDTKTGRVIDFITRQDGSYRFDELDMNIDYELTAKSNGYSGPVTKKLSKYDSRKPATLNFELKAKDKKQG